MSPATDHLFVVESTQAQIEVFGGPPYISVYWPSYRRKDTYDDVTRGVIACVRIGSPVDRVGGRAARYCNRTAQFRLRVRSVRRPGPRLRRQFLRDNFRWRDRLQLYR